MYVAVTIVGVGVIVLGVVPAVVLLSATPLHKRPLAAARSMAGLGVTTAAWAAKQFRLPLPLDAPRRRSGWWLWLTLFVVLLLMGVGILFFFMYFLHEML
jgi:hypothetical protein